MAMMLVPISVGDAQLVSSTIAEPDASEGEIAWDNSTSFTIGQRRIRAVSGVHTLFESITGQSHVVTISNASPAVVTWAGHGLQDGQALTLTTTGGLPAPLQINVTLYVLNAGADSFNLALSVNGPAINTTTAGTGTHTAVVSTNVGNIPESSPLHWVEVQATNRWALLDKRIDSASFATNTATYVWAPGVVVDSIGFAGLINVRTVHLVITAPGLAEPLFDETYDLDSTQIVDWWDWLYAEDDLRRSYAILNLDGRPDATISITFQGSGRIGVGMLMLANAVFIGKMTYQPKISLLDYSVKTTNRWGYVEIEEGGFVRTLEGRLELANGMIEKVRRKFEAVRAKPIMIVGVLDHDALTEPLTSVGFYREFAIEIPYPEHSLLSLNMEGLVQA